MSFEVKATGNISCTFYQNFFAGQQKAGLTIQHTSVIAELLTNWTSLKSYLLLLTKRIHEIHRGLLFCVFAAMLSVWCEELGRLLLLRHQKTRGGGGGGGGAGGGGNNNNSQNNSNNNNTNNSTAPAPNNDNNNVAPKSPNSMNNMHMQHQMAGKMPPNMQPPK